MRSPQACAVADVTYRQLDYWSRIGLFDGKTVGRGSGTQRSWDEPQVIALCAVRLITGLGQIQVRRLHDAVGLIRERWEADPYLRDAWLIISRDEVRVDVVPAVAGPVATVVNLEACAAQVREHAAAMAS